jgi:hypothetical protein
MFSVGREPHSTADREVGATLFTDKFLTRYYKRLIDKKSAHTPRPMCSTVGHLIWLTLNRC